VVNGKPGDHPLTDILGHRLEVFGETADSLIREICQLGGEPQLESRFDLLSIDPRSHDKTSSHLIWRGSSPSCDGCGITFEPKRCSAGGRSRVGEGASWSPARARRSS
jgi:hypothetical protein